MFKNRMIFECDIYLLRAESIRYLRAQTVPGKGFSPYCTTLYRTILYVHSLICFITACTEWDALSVLQLLLSIELPILLVLCPGYLRECASVANPPLPLSTPSHSPLILLSPPCLSSSLVAIKIFSS
jgi:hypothetical protein